MDALGRIRRGAGLMAVSLVLSASGAVASAVASSSTVPVTADLNAFDNFQADAAHDGQAAAALAPDLGNAWRVAFDGPVRYTLIDDNRVFVVLDDALVALDAASGLQLWKQPLPGLLGATVSGDEIVDVDGSGMVRAFSVNNGARLWSRLLKQGSALGPPTSNNGVIYVTDATDHADLYALDAATSNILWSSPLGQDGDTAPSVADGVVILDYPCEATAFKATDGSTQWGGYNCSLADRGGVPLVPIHDGTAWIADATYKQTNPETAVNDQTGNTVTTTSVRGTSAFDGTRRFVDQNGQLTAAEESLPDVPLWSSAATDYSSPPIAFGTSVAVIGDSDRLDVLDQQTGMVTWSSPVLAYAMSSGGQFGYLAVGDGLLTAPVGDYLFAFDSNTQGLPPHADAPNQPTVPAAVAPTPAGSDVWSGIGGSDAHSGVSGDGFSATLPQVWRRDIGQPVGQPLIEPGLVVVPAIDPNEHGTDVYGLDPTTGHVLWGPDVLTESSIDVTMSETDGVIIVGASGYVGDWGISAATGAIIWFDEGGGFDAPQADDSGHFYDRGAEYDALTGNLIAGTATGSRSTPLAITGSTTYLNDENGDLIRSDNGTQTYDGFCPGVGSGLFAPANLLGSTVIIPGVNSPSGVIDAFTGECLGVIESTFHGTIQTVAQVAADGNDAVAIESDDVVDLDPTTGAVKWRTSFGARPQNQIVVGQSQMLVSTDDNQLVTLDRATGAVLGSTAVSAPVTNTLVAALAAAQGIVLVSTTTGVIAYSDGTPAGTATASPSPSPAGTATSSSSPSPAGTATSSPSPLPSRTPMSSPISTPGPSTTPAVDPTPAAPAAAPTSTSTPHSPVAKPTRVVVSSATPSSSPTAVHASVSLPAAAVVPVLPAAVVPVSLRLSLPTVTAGSAVTLAATASRGSSAAGGLSLIVTITDSLTHAVNSSRVTTTGAGTFSMRLKPMHNGNVVVSTVPPLMPAIARIAVHVHPPLSLQVRRIGSRVSVTVISVRTQPTVGLFSTDEHGRTTVLRLIRLTARGHATVLITLPRGTRAVVCNLPAAHDLDRVSVRQRL